MPAEKKVILTEEGKKKLEDELNDLKLVRRREIAEKIKDARGQGDLSENAEYDAAREEQAKIEARIEELEQKLRNVKVIETDANKNRISIGSQVKLLDIEFQEEVIFMIVGSTESDPSNGKISNESPLGNALIGHKTGDIIEVNSPDGIIKYKVIEII
ncbi:MAG: transcription elongation factor GreA [Firmicutes bacterium]|nr:transcription elongation factor GreA [Bacillota bacterium]